MNCDKNMQTYEYIDMDLQGAWECCICGAIIRNMKKHTGFDDLEPDKESLYLKEME